MFVLACYDVPAKRTQKYRKILIQYLMSIQESVFGGDLTETMYKELQRKIRNLYEEDDYITWLTTENRHNVRMEHWKGGEETNDNKHRGSGVL